jgi:hypothetical protein
LNGGSNAGDNCDVTVDFGSGSPVTLTNVNSGQTWEGWTKHTVSIPVPSGLKGGGITDVKLHTGFNGGDNWNVERVQLMATLDPASLIVITVVAPAATQYSHSATLKLNYSATDTGGPGLKPLVATIDGSSTVAGKAIVNGLSIPLLTALSLGTHTFKVVATDVWDNSKSSTVTFEIVVTSASIQEDVGQLAANGQIDPSQENPLLAQLRAAADARSRGDCKTAANIYNAFINHVQAQTGKKIDPDAAAILIADAQYLIDHCP